MKHSSEIAFGVGLAGAIVLFAQFLTDEQTIEFFAIVLAVIASIYVGFALSDGRLREIAIEVFTAIIFGICALAGLWVFPIALPIGYIAHGFWDMVHHQHGIKTKVIDWYIPFCVVVDWLLGAYLIFWLMTSSNV
ncbi:MAG: hypothetical protein Phog2KO_45390 [Phototrophicaceae bacterium]